MRWRGSRGRISLSFAPHEQMTMAQDQGSITDPVEMTADERRDYIDTYPCVEELFTCVRGHDGCSISRVGVCLDDVLRYMEAHGEMK
jgi:hypothetical protein